MIGENATIWLYAETLLVEFADQSLAQYSVTYETNHRQLRTITPRQLFKTKHETKRPPLWELGDG